MKNQELAKVYKEVLTVIDAFDIQDNIPQNVLQKMISEQDSGYEYFFDVDMPVNEQKISRQAAAILSVLYIKYICIDENEKLELKEMYEKNAEKPELKSYIDEFIRDIETFKDVNSEDVLKVEELKNEENGLQVKSQNLFEKIKNFFKMLFEKL